MPARTPLIDDLSLYRKECRYSLSGRTIKGVWIMKRLYICVLFLCAFAGSVFADSKWTLYKTDYETGTMQEMIYALAIEDNTIWVGTAGGVVKWNRKTGAFFRYTAKDGLVNDYISAIAIDHNGVKWFGHYCDNTPPVAITSYNNVAWKHYTKETVPEFAQTDSVYNDRWKASIDDILVDPTNTVLISSSGYYLGPTTTSELFIFDQNGWKIKHIGGGSSFKMVLDTASPDTVWYGADPGAGYMVKPDYIPKKDIRYSSVLVQREMDFLVTKISC